MMKKMLLGALLILFQAACSDGASALEKPEQITIEKADVISDATLREAIINYYNAESRGDWETTYGFRLVEFKKLVSLDYYKRGMVEGMTGWKLQKIEVLAHTIGKSETTVRIRFHEKIDSTVAKLLSGVPYLPIRMSIDTENSLWRKVGERWLCVDAGKRRHLPLNNRMAYE